MHMYIYIYRQWCCAGHRHPEGTRGYTTTVLESPPGPPRPSLHTLYSDTSRIKYCLMSM